jgi:molybdopterin converting factor small subunit
MASDIGLQIKVLFFASAREAAKGTTETTLVLDSGADTAILR